MIVTCGFEYIENDYFDSVWISLFVYRIVKYISKMFRIHGKAILATATHSSLSTDLGILHSNGEEATNVVNFLKHE